MRERGKVDSVTTAASGSMLTPPREKDVRGRKQNRVGAQPWREETHVESVTAGPPSQPVAKSRHRL
ncbi:hypothetical protein AHAS_Ahas04G0059400 [Arachis hypogaea]